MGRPDPVVAEIVIVVAVGALLGAAGPAFGAGAWPLAAALAGYVGWNLYQFDRFRRWLAHPKRARPPYRVGLWRTLVDGAQDIRDRARTRKKRLRRILEGFQESTSALPDATVVLDREWNVEWTNAMAHKYLGIARGGEQLRSILEYIGDRLFRQYLETGDFTRPLQMPAPVDDGTTLEVRVVPYGKGKLLVQARDITRLHLLETVRRDFVANVSHELRTPLTVVHGYLESMIDADDDDQLDHWKPILDQMHQQSGRLQRIVDDLLTLSRLETRSRGEGMETIAVAGMLERLVGAARSLSADSAHVIELQADESLGLYGNPSEIESAFSNLVYNAVRYTPAGGRITLRWQLVDGEPWFSVKDTGVGIEAKHLPRLTERFYRVDVGRSRERGGTGLGLAIVKHVLLRHGGRLRIESQPGKGSTFSCRFPADLARRLDAAKPRPAGVAGR